MSTPFASTKTPVSRKNGALVAYSGANTGRSPKDKRVRHRDSGNRRAVDMAAVWEAQANQVHTARHSARRIRPCSWRSPDSRDSKSAARNVGRFTLHLEHCVCSGGADADVSRGSRAQLQLDFHHGRPAHLGRGGLPEGQERVCAGGMRLFGYRYRIRDGRWLAPELRKHSETALLGAPSFCRCPPCCRSGPARPKKIFRDACHCHLSKHRVRKRGYDAPISTKIRHAID